MPCFTHPSPLPVRNPIPPAQAPLGDSGGLDVLAARYGHDAKALDQVGTNMGAALWGGSVCRAGVVGMGRGKMTSTRGSRRMAGNQLCGLQPVMADQGRNQC